MKRIIASLVLLSGSCFAVDPYTFVVTHYDSGGNFQQRLVAKPDNDSQLFYNSSTNTISWSFLSSLSVTSSQISDTSSIGRDLMSASDAAAARSTIGAGTSNFSGDYNDLTNRITNNNQLTNGSGFITAVTAPVTSVNTKTGALTLNASDVGAAATSHNHTASNISDSTSIGRSLITATNQAAVQAIVGMPASQVNSDWSATSGVSQILNKPAKYSGSTNGSGVYAVTYGSAYSVKPHVVFSVEGGTNKDTTVLTSTTTTGFSILVERRTDIVGLLPSYAAVSGITVNVTVTP
jgi:hypothetical protein